MKIRFLLHNVYGQAGGVLSVSLALARDLARTHDVEIVSLFGGGTPVHPLPPGVPVTSLIGGGASSEGSLLRRRLSRVTTRVVPEGDTRFSQYSLYTDLVLMRYLRSVRGGAVIAMQPGLNVALARLGTDRYVRVAQDHRPFVTRPKSTILAYDKHAGRLDTLLTLTTEDTAHYEKMFNGRARVQTMPNGTPAYDGPPSTLTNKVAVAAGRLEPSKGFHMLVDAWTEVAGRHPDWQLRIYGEGSQRDLLHDRIASRELQGKVQLMGYTTQLQREMAAASFGVLSSKAEGYPMVLLEAMGCGLPLVSTDCPAGGPRDIITPGVDGFLVKNRDTEAMTQGLLTMIEVTDDKRRSMGEAALVKARERSQEAIADRWASLLEELSQRRGLG